MSFLTWTRSARPVASWWISQRCVVRILDKRQIVPHSITTSFCILWAWKNNPGCLWEEGNIAMLFPTTPQQRMRMAI